MALNVELLRKVKEHILAEPRRLVMNSWWINAAGAKTYKNDHGEPEEFAACGTAACIAGWTVILGEVDFDNSTTGSVIYRAMNVLKIDRWEAMRLFHLERWPNDLREQYQDAQTAAARAAIAAKVIDDFIKKEEKC